MVSVRILNLCRLCDKLLFIPLFFLPVIHAIPYWIADRASPYSNYWSNSDSFGPLLWLQGDLHVSPETAWGQLVEQTTIPFLRVVHVLLAAGGLDARDFQDIIVLANIAFAFMTFLVIGGRIVRSFAVTLFAYASRGFLLQVVPLGYSAGLSYGEWGSYRPFSGVLSMNWAELALALWLGRFRRWAIGVTVALVLFHPATGGLTAGLLGLCLLAEDFGSSGGTCSLKPPFLHFKELRFRIAPYMILASPVVFMLAWGYLSGYLSVPPDYPWNIWWNRVVGNAALHVAPWTTLPLLIFSIAGYIPILCMAAYVLSRRELKRFQPFAVMLAATFGCLAASILLSKFLGVYFFTGFYLHKATAFAPFIAVALVLSLLRRSDLDENHVVIVQLAALSMMLTFSVGAPLDHRYLLAAIGLAMGTMWVFAACRRFGGRIERRCLVAMTACWLCIG